MGRVSRPASEDRGRDAEEPTQVPLRGWKDVLWRVKEESKDDHLMLLSAGVAFFGLLAAIPALGALLSIYGLVADPDKIDEQLTRSLAAAPQEVRDLISQQVQDISRASSGALLAVVGGLLLALWSASSGMKHLIDGVNVAYDEEETRGFVKLRLLAIVFTMGALLFLAAAFTALTVLPSLVAATNIGTAGRIFVSLFRFVVLFVGFVAGLAVLYRYAPDRDNPRLSWASPGAVLAAVLWMIGSVLFSIYTANFGSYNETYGALGAVVVVMLWLLLTSFVIIFGAEVNCELERQTTRDTTKKPREPLGDRDAYAADTVGQPPG